jgi:GTP 3',8-cyclase
MRSAYPSAMAEAAALSTDDLVDRHGRAITYLRLSVTDRCDLRCRYCMAEQMTFLPRAALLSLEEMALIAERFVARGVRRIRLTGGEPLVRRDMIELVRRLGRHVGAGLDELTLTTNGTRLAQHARALHDAGVRRINVSLDSRDPATFRHVTRHGDLAQVLDGIAAAREAGLLVKINMVALKGLNEAEIPDMLIWAASQGHDLTLIETMPLGFVDEDRTDRFLPLPPVLAALRERFGLVADPHATGGPARYWRVPGTRTRLGLISPLTENFCATCNRVRLSSDGKLHMCLGHEAAVDLRDAIRSGGMAAVDRAISHALAIKPERHDFRIGPDAQPAVTRHMSVTGG